MELQFADDIPLSTAQAAHNGTSFVPERRAQQERDDYQQTLAADYESLSTLADTDEKRATLDEEFERYRAGYRKHTLAWLGSRSRMMSTMITGGSNFPVRQQEKIGNTAHKRLTELLEYRERALKAIRRTLQPELRPIMSGDADAVERLDAEIAEAQALQDQMKAINAAHKKFLKDPASLDKSDLPEETKQRIRNYKPEYSWEPHPIPPYRLSNNSANIRRMQQRREQISKMQAMPETKAEGNGVRLEDCPAENRVRLFFSGKPDAEVRTTLKSRGFRWAPSIGCWQAYRNHGTLTVAQSFVQS